MYSCSCPLDCSYCQGNNVLPFCCPVVLFSVGNKNDCPAEKKVVDTADANKFADQMGIRLWETSAKENEGVEEVSMFAGVRCSLRDARIVLQHCCVARRACFARTSVNGGYPIQGESPYRCGSRAL